MLKKIRQHQDGTHSAMQSHMTLWNHSTLLSLDKENTADGNAWFSSAVRPRCCNVVMYTELETGRGPN